MEYRSALGLRMGGWNGVDIRGRDERKAFGAGVSSGDGLPAIHVIYE